MTIKDVAKTCGVSPMTVSFVLNDKPGEVSDSTRSLVRDAAQRMGYRPNHLARALVTGRSHSITLWMKTQFPPYSAQVLHHVRQQVEGTGLMVNIWDMQYPMTPEKAARADSYPQWPAEGILALEGREWVDHCANSGVGPHTPIISLGSDCSHSRDFVQLDLEAGTVEAVRHLVESGCRRIGYLVPQRALKAEDTRFMAYTRTVQDAGLTPEYIAVAESFRSDARAGLTDYLQQHGHPEGLFCYNDEMAIGANRALRELNLRVPEDVALVGCDGIEETEYQSPALSTISLPLEEMCQLGWRFLQQRIAQPDLPWQQAVLPTHLVIRESSRKIG